MQLGMAMMIGVLAVFSFCATSKARESFVLNKKIDKKYELPFSKAVLLGKLKSEYAAGDSIQNMADSLFYIYFFVDEYYSEATALVKIRQIDDKHTIIQLDSVTQFAVRRNSSDADENTIKAIKKLTSAEFEKYFERDFIMHLSEDDYKDGFYFDNKNELDKYNSGQ
ncbi:hypothetical protein GCM10023149_50970 [Mucilaginibacter gynuensis]|uniref:Uncharacterized protein n=2 Tax=Mucilaginibacter gynuensis TaxID=1302236 RepID=A0ABP8HIU9_9SPHI